MNRQLFMEMVLTAHILFGICVVRILAIRPQEFIDSPDERLCLKFPTYTMHICEGVINDVESLNHLKTITQFLSTGW